MGWRSRDVVRAAALVMALYLMLKLLWFAHQLVLVVFLGVLFGLAVTAGVDRLQRLRVPRGVGAPLIVFGFLGLLVGFGAWTAPTLRSQSKELRTKLPEAFDKFEGWVDRKQNGFLGVVMGAGGDSVSDRAASRDTATSDSAAGMKDSATWARDSAAGTRDTVPDRAAGAMGDTAAANGSGGQLRGKLFEGVSGAKRYLKSFVTSTFAAVAGLLLVVFLAIYTSVDPDTYHNGLMHLFPHRARARAGEVLSSMATVLRKWLVTQLIAMAAIGLVTTGVLLLLGVKAALPLGVLAGLLEFIPTIGPVLSAVPAILMAFVDSPQKALTVGLAYVGIQFLENHILIPLLMKEGVDIPPALTIVAQALMAMLFGFLGLLVAVPLLAAATVAVKLLYVEDVVGDASPVLADDD